MTTKTKPDEQVELAEFLAQSGDGEIPKGSLQPGMMVDADGNTTQSDPEAALAEGEVRLEDLNFKGYAEVWDNRTGERALQPKNLLWQTFTLKREDGSRIYTGTDPKIPQNYGLDLLCRQHPDSPDYPSLQRMGFKPCYKKHTPTRIALDDHMRHTHKRTYVVLKDEDARREREIDRDLNRQAIEANHALVAAMAQNVTARQPEAMQGEDAAERVPYVSEKPKRQRRKRTAR